MWKHNVLKEAARACSCNLTAYVEAVLLHKTARCLVLFSQAVKPILKLRVKQKFFYHYFGILLKGAAGRLDTALIPCNLSFSLKFSFIASETRILLSCQLLGSKYIQVTNQLGAIGMDGQFGHIISVYFPSQSLLTVVINAVIIKHQDNNSSSDLLKNILKFISN